MVACVNDGNAVDAAETKRTVCLKDTKEERKKMEMGSAGKRGG